MNISLSLTKSLHALGLSKCCYSHIRQVCCIRPYLDLKTASAVATSIVHSKLDYCNSLYFNLTKSQINRLQLIQNSLARVVVKAAKSCHISPVLYLNLCTGSKLMNELITSYSLLHTRFSLSRSPLTCITLSLSNLLAVLVLPLLLLLLALQPAPH